MVFVSSVSLNILTGAYVNIATTYASVQLGAMPLNSKTKEVGELFKRESC